MLRETMEAGGVVTNAEIIMPFFAQGGRITLDGTHYVRQGGAYIPVGETEFARDPSFGFHSSHLLGWLREKGADKDGDILQVSLRQLREDAPAMNRLTETLCGLKRFTRVLVDAVDELDARLLARAALDASGRGSRLLFRCASSLVKALGNIPDSAPLAGGDLPVGSGGGLIVVGSHVEKTSVQLRHLLDHRNVIPVEFDQRALRRPNGLCKEALQCRALAEDGLRAGNDVALYTRRGRCDFAPGNREAELRAASEISCALAGIVRNLEERPAFFIAKGGVTSSDMATRGLGVRRARVAGQLLPGVAVWITQSESRFPHLPFVVFPGNVGGEMDLTRSVELMRGGV